VRLQSKLDAEAKERERIQRLLDAEQLETTKLKAQLTALQADLWKEQTRNKGAERTVARLDAERTAAEKKVQSETNRVAETRHEVEAKVAEVGALEAENRRLLLEAQKMRTVISVLERDRERIRQQVRGCVYGWLRPPGLVRFSSFVRGGIVCGGRHAVSCTGPLGVRLRRSACHTRHHATPASPTATPRCSSRTWKSGGANRRRRCGCARARSRRWRRRSTS
jgi:hypothetical protein